MNSSLEKIIEYIINNFKYGSELNETEIETLFRRFPINEECKKEIYSELDSLEIKIIPLKNDTSISNSKQLLVNEQGKNEDYSFLDDIEFEELDDIIAGDGFKKDISKLIEVIDRKYNLEYLEDYSISKDNPESRLLSLSRLTAANEKLIWKVVMRYKQFVTTSFDADDMYQAGAEGLLEAIERFDLSKGYQFSTYATWWIKQSISRSICNYSTTIRLPVHMHEEVVRFTRLENRMIDENNYEIDDEILAREYGCAKEKINQLRKYRSLANLTSLSKSVGEDGDSTIEDFVEDQINDSPDVAFEKIELKNIIKELCDTKLKPKEKEIIDLRFGLTDNIPRTLEEIGKKYNVTRERIRQIEVKAIRKLTTNCIKKRLGDFYDDSE